MDVRILFPEAGHPQVPVTCGAAAARGSAGREPGPAPDGPEEVSSALRPPLTGMRGMKAARAGMEAPMD